jgi:tetratricopeptide (TPR) repeat protein
LQSNPTDPQAQYEVGNFLFAHGRYDEAASLWGKAIKEGFEDAALFRNRGEFEWRVALSLPDAAEDYRRALSLQPNEYRLYADLDEIYEEESNMRARSELFEKAPQRVLSHDTVRARHILFLIEQRRFDDALAELANHTFKPWEGGVSFHNLYVEASMQDGQQELADGRTARAEKHFRAAMRLMRRTTVSKLKKHGQMLANKERTLEHLARSSRLFPFKSWASKIRLATCFGSVYEAVSSRMLRPVRC